MKWLTLPIAWFLINFASYAQQVSNIRAELDGEEVKITYNLLSDDPNLLFEIELYASHNNFSSPLQKVTGDVGDKIQPGDNKVMIWRPYEELTDFSGEIIFEIRATVIGGYYEVTHPSSASKYKKKKTLPIKWKGGESTEKVLIELVKYGSPVLTIADGVNNSGSYNWSIPKDFETGAGYQVKITNVNDLTLTGSSKVFKISGGIPTWLLVGVPVVVGGAVAGVVMSGGDGGEEPDPVETNTDLPEPPDAPNQ